MAKRHRQSLIQKKKLEKRTLYKEIKDVRALLFTTTYLSASTVFIPVPELSALLFIFVPMPGLSAILSTSIVLMPRLSTSQSAYAFALFILVLGSAPLFAFAVSISLPELLLLLFISTISMLVFESILLSASAMSVFLSKLYAF